MNYEPKTTDPWEGATIDYYSPNETNLLDRWQSLTIWANERAANGLDSFSRSTSSRIGTETRAISRDGRSYQGVNFASQEYLSLANDPRILKAANEAAERHGVHSAGSAALMGLTDLTLDLERRLADFVKLADATVFPTGWAAGYGVIRTLAKENDHIIIDVLAHACLQEAASLTTRNLHRSPHGSTEGIQRRLERIRKKDPNAGILVVTESLFSMDSDVPNIREIQDLCHLHNATLMLDVAHDLGAIGPTGRGFMEVQGVLGEIDVVMGSFSKSFASNGGFVATNHPALKLALRYMCGPLTFSNSLSPVQAAVVLQALDIIDSEEGQGRRRRLMRNVVALRECLEQAGFELLGQPSATVPVLLGGTAVSREMTSHLLEGGALVNLVEYPAVSRNACRWRAQVMADHTTEQIHRFVELADASRSYAKQRVSLVLHA
ncbi:MAG: aminotransferase class I/II-fold pyridoxal phosphate-dependent enzyme [Pseudomonadota bacterium]